MTDEVNREISKAFRSVAGLLTPEQIRAGREGLGLTQEEMAEALRINKSTLSRWETGGQIQQRSLDALMRVFCEFSEVRDSLAARREAVAASG